MFCYTVVFPREVIRNLLLELFKTELPKHKIPQKYGNKTTHS